MSKLEQSYDTLCIILDNLSQIEIVKLLTINKNINDLVEKYLESNHTIKINGDINTHYFRNIGGYRSIGYVMYNIVKKALYVLFIDSKQVLIVGDYHGFVINGVIIIDENHKKSHLLCKGKKEITIIDEYSRKYYKVVYVIKNSYLSQMWFKKYIKKFNTKL